MRASRSVGFAAAVLAGGTLFATGTFAAPPVAGPNVNMVSGTKFPEGDPSLTKQNEESHAVSSRNPRHLMGGANDYRQVPILAAEGARGGKAWIQIYKSVDGGESWRSTPLGGCPVNHPQCNDPTGLTAAVKALKPDFSADPTMRPGPFGTFFLSFIAGKRDTASDGMIGVQRFVDKNNDIQRNTDLRSCAAAGPGCSEVRIPAGCSGGPPACSVSYVRYKPAEDPFLPDKVTILDLGTPGQFNDKPWNAADVPGRPWNAGKTCELLSWTKNRTDVSNVAETVPAFNVYVSFAKFVGQDPLNEHPQVHVAVSTDCGNTFDKPLKLTPGSLGQNSGTNMAIDPLTGAVYVVWRNFDGESEIYLSKSTDGGKTWSKKPVLVAKFNPYDQGTTGASFRTLAFPTIAVSVVGTTSRVHVAWSQRKAMPASSPPYACQANDPADCDARVVLTTSLDNGDTWPVPTPVDSNFTVQYETKVGGNYQVRSHQRGHQVQPAMAFAAGKLLITWLDQRLDHTEGVLRCPAGNTCTSVNDLVEFREGVGNLDAACTNSALPSPYGPACNNPAVVFRTYMSDGEPGLVRRHTLDVYAAMASPANVPDFSGSSARVSQYTFGSTVAGVIDPQTGNLTPTPGIYPIRQKEVNAPNLPMFSDGRAAFIGDYIEAAGQHIVGTGDPARPYKYNVGGGANGNFTTSGLAPVFHVSFTDNRDVIPPLDGNWATPSCLSTKLTTDNTGVVNGSTNFSGCTTPGYAGNRNANVYTAVVAENSLAFAYSNSKLLSTSVPRGFTVTLQNLSDKPRTYTLTLPAQASGVTAAFNQQMTSTSPLTVIVQPRSSSTRSVWAKISNATLTKSKVLVLATSSDANGTFSSQLVLNPDPNGAFVTNGDGTSNDVANDDLGNVVLSNAVLTNNALSNNALTNNVLTNNALTNAVLSNVMLSNAVLTNFQLENLDPSNAALTNNVLTNNALSNVVLSNAVLSNNALSNAVLSNAVLTNSVLNAALTNLDPGNVALSNAVLSNNALTNVVLSNNTLGNAMLSNAVLSNAALSNAVLSNAALSNNVLTNNALSNNVLSNNVLTNAPLIDTAGGETPKTAASLRTIEPASFELTSSPYTTSDLQNSNFRETSFTVRNRGNTDATLSIKLMLRDAICTGAPTYTCTTPAGYKLQLILRKVAFAPSAIAPTGPATDTGRALRIGLTQRNAIVSNIGTLPLIDPDDPNLGKFLPDDPSAATLALGAGEFAYATIRAVGLPGAGPPPDPAELLRWGVKTVSANSTGAAGALLIRTLSLPTNLVPLNLATPPFRTVGGVPPVSGSATCSDKDGNPILVGVVAPEGSVTGADGNFYIDTSARLIYGPKAGSGNTGWGPSTPQIGVAGLGDPQAGPKAKLACPPAGIVVNPFPATPDPNASTLSFTPRFWGEFFVRARVFDSTSGAVPEDQGVLRAYVQPRLPALNYPGFPATLVYNNNGAGIDLRPYVTSDSADGAGVPQPILFAASGSCHVAPDGYSLVIDRATIPQGGPADCIVNVSQAGNEIYAPISVNKPIYIDRASQTIGFTVLPVDNQLTFQQTPPTLVASVSSPTAPASGLTVTFNSSTPGVCTTGGTNGATVTIVAAGTCAITADQGGDPNYKPAPQLTPSFVIKKADQNIALVAPTSAPYNASFVVSASSSSPTAPSSGLPITLGSSTGSICTISGATVTILTVGTCTISADQVGNGNYNAAPQVTRNITITKADQNIVFGAAPAGATFGDPPVSVSATSTSSTAPPSGTAITFSSQSASCTTGGVNGSTVTIVAAGTCTIAADQAGSTNYNMAPQVTQNFNIAKAPVQFTVDSLYFTSLGDTTTTVTGKLSRTGFPAVFPPDAPTIAVAPNSTTLTSSVPGGGDGTFTANGTTPASGTYSLTFNYAGNANFAASGAPATSKLRVEGFSSAGTMIQPRARHRMVLLDDGRVLIAGGFYTSAGAYARTNTAEVYCPDTMSPPPTLAQCPNGVGAFTAVGSLSSGSDSLTLTKLLDGRVLKVGGKNVDVEIFDPATNAWTLLPAALLTPRAHHQATLLTCTEPCGFNGKVLISGGDDAVTLDNASANTLSSTLIFDPATNTLSAGPDMSTPRDSHSATALGDGRVLIAGGEQWSNAPTTTPRTYAALSSAEIFDPTAPACAPATFGCMANVPSMTDARFSDGAVLLANGKVLIAGGSNDPSAQRTGLLASFEIFDPIANSWTSGSMTESRRAHSLTLLYGGNWALAVGGFGPEPPPDDIKRRATSELFDPALTQFDLGDSLATPRARHRAIRLLDGRVLITGGTIDIPPGNTFVLRDSAINSAEFYNSAPPP